MTPPTTRLPITVCLLTAATLLVCLVAPTEPVRAQPPRPGVARAATAGAPVPIIFVHGNGDHAGLWDNTLWRFESNGYPRDRLFAVDLPNPQATSTLAARETNRSTPDDQAAALAAFVTRVLVRTGAPKVALVGSSRGGLTIRHYVRFGGGAAHVSHVITCGTPNHGVMALPTMQTESEFNGLSPYLRALNGGSEVVPGVRFLTLRSDSLDKYAQPTGAALGAPGMQTGVDVRSPELAGARNVVLPGTDHREVAFGPEAFAAQYEFLTGRAPRTTVIAPDSAIVLDGMVSASVAGAPTNLPLARAAVTVHEVDATTGERTKAAVHRTVTRDDGRWGPFRGRAGAHYEFEIAAPDSSVMLHLYRSPFPRSSPYVHFRLPAPSRPLGDSVSVLIIRPRGYLGVGRDTVLFNNAPAVGITPGVPSADRALRWYPADAARSVRTQINGEVLVVRTHPQDRRRLVAAEFQRE
ncbi:MAG: alpha/beta fold hydrolase [Gemmatimonas sp.]|jgi:pimeloyl-ACP methyl ester carboxylesterase|uniref:alpha/beta fold hydrolase n=1 Tax=Gemmatimonas sp. TaxID=1962908 RepID=UPI00391FC770|nr:alpha/beta fold hydrolase [Gemmatimonadota bacterium]